MSTTTPPQTPGMIGGVRLITADDVCAEIENVLRAELPFWAHLVGLADAAEVSAEGQVRSWDQLPDPAAISTAQLPAGAIASPGLTSSGVPTRRGGVLRWDATYRVAVAVYDRGGDFNQTQSRCRRWAALLATVILRHQRLNGLSESVTCITQQTTPSGSPTSARTFAQAIAIFDVTCKDVWPLGAATPDPTGQVPERPTVTKSTVSVVTGVTTRPPTSPS